MEIRVVLDGVDITVDGETLPVHTPSAEQSGLKIHPIDLPAFEIVENERSAAVILLDPFRQMIRNRGRGFIFHPTLEAEQVDARELLGVIPDQIVVGFAVGTSDADIDAVIAELHAERLWCYPRDYCTLRLPIDQTLEGALLALEGRAGVEFALPNTIVVSDADPPPDDPRYLDDSLAQLEQVSVYGTDPAEGAWDRTTGSHETVIAIIDGGAWLNHLDLIENTWINVDEVPDAVLAAAGDRDGDGMPSWRDLDFPGDGILTFSDLDARVAEGLLEACDLTATFPPDRCNPGDLVDGTGDVYGWQDRIDGADVGDLVDDVVGWRFVEGGVGTNLPIHQEVTAGHGTAIAGILGGIGNNGLDVAGINWSVPRRTRS